MTTLPPQASGPLSPEMGIRKRLSAAVFFPAIFALHIVEESRGFPRWVSGVLHGEMEVSAFYVNNAAFMIVLVGLCLVSLRTRSRAALWALFLWTSGQQLFNAVFHVYTRVVFNAYSPGIFTAVFGYVPVYTYLTYLVLRERLLPGGSCRWASLLGAVGMWFDLGRALPLRGVFRSVAGRRSSVG